MAVVTFSTKVWRTKELGTCSSYHRSRGQRHWRRWYKQGGMFGMGGRGGLATAAIAEQSGLPVWCCSWRARYDRGGRSIGWLSTGIVQGSVLRILICCKGDQGTRLQKNPQLILQFVVMIQLTSRRILRDQDETPEGMFYIIYQVYIPCVRVNVIGAILVCLSITLVILKQTQVALEHCYTVPGQKQSYPLTLPV